MSSTTHRRFDPWRTAPVQEMSRREILQTHCFNIDQVAFDSLAGEPFERDFIHVKHGDTVGVLAVTDDGRIPLVEQYRLSAHRWTLEIPGGHESSHLDRPMDIARRKLEEEAGFQAGDIKQFLRIMDMPGYSTQYTSLFYATNLTATQASDFGPETPRPALRLVTPEEAYQMVLNGTILDAKSLVALLSLHNGLLDHYAAEGNGN